MASVQNMLALLPEKIVSEIFIALNAAEIYAVDNKHHFGKYGKEYANLLRFPYKMLKPAKILKVKLPAIIKLKFNLRKDK